MAKFNTGQSFADGDQVTGAKLNNIIGLLDIYSGVIADQTSIAATVSTADLLLIADTDAGSSGAANKVTIQKLLNDTLTGGTFTNANIAEQLTYGTATGNRTVSTSETITNGTISNATLGTTTGTLATITNLTAGTTTSTAANITSGTVQTLTASTATITGGTYSGAINSTLGTIATLNSTTGTVATLNSTTGTVATLNSTTGTITNLSTTLAGDFTISQGTATLSTTGATAATYGTTGVIPRIAVDSKGRITSIGTALGGKILQVVESTYSTSVAVASTSFSDTGLSSSITPTYSSSRILVLAQQNSYCTRSASSIGAKLKIVRTIGAIPTDIYSQGTSALDIFISIGASTSVNLVANVFVECVDSPSTTSQCTYKLQGAATTIANSGQVIFQDGNSISKLILMEVAA